MIRHAVFNDNHRLVEMGKRFLSESDYGELLGTDGSALPALMDKLIGSPDALVLVADVDGGDLIGMLAALIYEHPMSGKKVAQELFWWVEPEHRGPGIEMLRQAEDWAKSKDASIMHMIAPTERVAKAYKTLGYIKIEEHYQRGLI